MLVMLECYTTSVTVLEVNCILKMKLLQESQAENIGRCASSRCAVPYIAACVDISRTVFRDHSVLHLPGKVLILVAKLLSKF